MCAFSCVTGECREPPQGERDNEEEERAAGRRKHNSDRSTRALAPLYACFLAATPSSSSLMRRAT